MALQELFMHRNSAYAATAFVPELKMMPILRSIIIACVDPRVDPTAVLGTEPGETAVIRNVGGRVTPDTLDQLALLRKVTQAAGGDFGPAWEFVVLQHTDCGITRLETEPALPSYLGVAPDALAGKSVAHPHAAVTVDVEAIRTDPRLAGVTVSGLVYDVMTGLVEAV